MTCSQSSTLDLGSAHQFLATHFIERTDISLAELEKYYLYSILLQGYSDLFNPGPPHRIYQALEWSNALHASSAADLAYVLCQSLACGSPRQSVTVIVGDVACTAHNRQICTRLSSENEVIITTRHNSDWTLDSALVTGLGPEATVLSDSILVGINFILHEDDLQDTLISRIADLAAEAIALIDE